MPNLRGSEWLIIILLIVLLFGAKRLPDAARGVGRSLRIFKAETKGLVEDSGSAPADGPAPGGPTAAPVTAAPASSAVAPPLGTAPAVAAAAAGVPLVAPAAEPAPVPQPATPTTSALQPDAEHGPGALAPQPPGA